MPSCKAARCNRSYIASYYLSSTVTNRDAIFRSDVSENLPVFWISAPVSRVCTIDLKFTVFNYVLTLPLINDSACPVAVKFDMGFDSSGGQPATVAGHAHLGAYMAAMWLFETLQIPIQKAVEAHPGYTLQLTGHSIGGACATILSIM